MKDKPNTLDKLKPNTIVTIYFKEVILTSSYKGQPIVCLSCEVL